MTLAERLRSKNKAPRVEELADLLGVAIRTVYKEVEDNRIPFFRIRSSIRFDHIGWLTGLKGKWSNKMRHRVTIKTPFPTL